LGVQPWWRPLGVVHGLVQPARPQSPSPPPSITERLVPELGARTLQPPLHLNFATTTNSTILHNTFILFFLILAAHSVINVFSSHLVALLNRISAWWMLGGVTVIVGVLIFGPTSHQDFSWVFGHRFNNTGFSGHIYWFFVLPLGFLLTMYTFTGYDASAHLSEETHDAERAAPRGLWKSIAYSAVGGWVLLLAITFAATHVAAINKGGGGAVPMIEPALSTGLAKLVLDISTVGQLFCGMGCVAAASRMVFAFSRDGAVPGHTLWRRLNKHRTPTWSVLFVVSPRTVDHDPGFVRQQRRPPGGVLRCHLDHHDRAVHRLHPARLPPLADGGPLRAGCVEPW
jgi:amino acid transporter